MKKAFDIELKSEAFDLRGLTEDEMETLRRADEIGLWKVLKKVLEADLHKKLASVIENPVVDDVNLKNDFRTKLGEAKKMLSLLRIPDMVVETIQKRKAEETSMK